MSNELMKVTATDALAISKQFYESGMFADIKSAGQALVKIMAGAEMGISPFASMSGIHIIQGKPTIGAGLMAAAVKASGKYDYKVVEQTEKNCSIDFFQGKEKLGNSSFSLEDAKKAQTKNLDKFPKNMLFARAMSNGVKWYTPDVFAGPVYTPEEMNTTEDTTAEVTTGVKITLHDEVKVVEKKPITDKQFSALLKRIEADGADVDALVKSTMASFTLDDSQAELFTSTVLKAQTPAANA